MTRLPVRSARVLFATGDEQSHPTVQCPRRGRATPFERCCGCPHMKKIDVAEDGAHGSVDCDVEAATAALPRGRVDVAEAAVRVRLGDILGTDTTCVTPDVALREARRRLTNGRQRALPVVDDSRRLVGMLSKTDLLRTTDQRRHRTKVVADAMTPLVHGLPEDAPVAYAISLMAFEGLHEVPVVDASGKVLGLVTSTDALRWVAGALGYVVPTNPAP